MRVALVDEEAAAGPMAETPRSGHGRPDRGFARVGTTYGQTPATIRHPAMCHSYR
jgi:hypothetical protein